MRYLNSVFEIHACEDNHAQNEIKKTNIRNVYGVKSSANGKICMLLIVVTSRFLHPSVQSDVCLRVSRDFSHIWMFTVTSTKSYSALERRHFEHVK